MREKIDKEVSVIMAYNSKQKKAQPRILRWQNQDFILDDADYYHSYMEGRDRQHVFELTDKEETVHFRLRLDTSNLHWTLETVHDGLAT